MAVTFPKAGNLGGGGYMVIHLAGGPGSKGGDFAIDYREIAPAAATRDMFLDAQGNADPQKSRDSALAIGVPGTVAGLSRAHAKYGSGKFTLAQLIAPAIALARDGIPVEDDVADSLPVFQQRLARWPATAKIFFRPDGSVLAPGDTLIQRDLADTLEDIARNGPASFYAGPTAARIAAAVQGAGGVMTPADLRAYRPIEYAPIRGSYRGLDIISMPPSSSGGVVLLEMLNILEGYKLGEMDDVTRTHLLIEAMKRGYFDRAKFLGDPAVVTPPGYLTDKDYAKRLRDEIDLGRATPAASLGSIFTPRREGDNTTHFSVVDADGNAVANTYTLNLSYGMGLVAEGTGVLLNNELDDFAAKPGVPNAFGLVGNEANAPGPGKRPLSSMTPTIVLKDGKPLIVTGSPGGSRIITTVLQVIVNLVDRGLPVAQAVTEPRVHHQWSPDEISAERGVAPELLEALAARGHAIAGTTARTSANTILITPQGITGAADTRTRGAAAVGY
jgi:gamma-glutamyltranspeptidase/glutathione hydrolase